MSAAAWLNPEPILQWSPNDDNRFTCGPSKESFVSIRLFWMTVGHAHHCLSNFHLKPLNQSDTVNPHSFLFPWFWQIDSTIDPSLRILATHQPQILIVWKIDEKKIVIFGYTIF